MEALASRTPGFDIVLAESLDRISRDPEHMARFNKLANRAGIEIHTVGRGKADTLAVGLASTDERHVPRGALPQGAPRDRGQGRCRA